MKHKNNRCERKAYSKPEVTRVELKPEESLAAGCKVTTESAFGGNNCTTPVQCFDSGS